MNKKIVTVIVATVALCIMLSLPCEAAATTKATTKDSKSISTVKKSAKKATKKTKKKASKKSTKKNKKKSNKKKYTASELRYMTCIIYCEARGESYAGQKAVGIVVMNRVRSDKFPNSIKKVIYQSGQFSPVRNGSLSRAFSTYDQQNKNKFKGEMKSCRKAAIEVLKGSTTIKVNGKNKEMKKYLFFSRYVRGAKYSLGAHQFK
ncbi:MAG: cell wall hydrolase [Clostridium sp.]|nr:cell wall hydrolase [Clostridium sp.]